MSILTGPEILKQVNDEKIIIDPFNDKHLNPASVDLTLGQELKYYDLDTPYLDAKHSNPTFSKTIEDEIVLTPGNLYLMHTQEKVWTESFVPVLDGKSSIGRLGIVIHLTAGFGDPGFDGQYTLEVTCVHPVKIYPGMRFCQIRFHTLTGEVLSYQKKGHYVKEAAQGAIASKSWQQFE